VELTAEREAHVLAHHPDLLPDFRRIIMETLLRPDQVRHSTRFSDAKLFSRWFEDLRSGKHVVVVVVSGKARHWIVTAYMARKLIEGEVEWKRK